MNELIKLNQSNINNEMVQTVNARELHAFLEVSSRYNDWIRNRISSYEFQENIDYVCLTKTLVTQTEEGREGVSTQKEHFITLDMAKELSMVERNDKGKQARKYFIECEKQLKQVFSPKQKFLLNILEANDELSRAVAINQYEVGYVKPLENKVEEQESELHIVRPKGDYFDLLVDRNLLTSFRDTAKEFCVGQKVFINFLIENKYIFRDSKGKLKPYQVHIDTGLFELKEFVNGGYTDVQTLVTPKGRETFRLLIELMLTNT